VSLEFFQTIIKGIHTMNRIQFVVVVCAAALFSSLLLIDSAAAQAASQPAASASSVKLPVAGVITLGVTIAETDLAATGWRASKLLKTVVYNDKNEKIGHIDDFIVSVKGELTIAVVDVGGFLGIAKHLVLVPVRQFTTFGAPKAILPGASKAELKKLPEFQYTQ